MNFSIVIPVYNESKNIKNLYNEITNNLKQYEYEVIFVDDCSLDETIIQINLLTNDKKVKLIKNKKNMGQSYSIKQGILNSSYDSIVTIDGDCQNDPKDIKKLIEIFFSNKEIYLVGGIRKNRKDNNIKILSSLIANYIRGRILKDNCKDTGCSLKIFDKKTFLEFPFFDGIHRFLPALFKGYGKKTTFTDVNHRPRIFGYSKYGIFNRLFRGIIDIIKVYIIIRKKNNNHD